MRSSSRLPARAAGIVALALLSAGAGSGRAFAQAPSSSSSWRPFAANVVIPQRRTVPIRGRPGVRLAAVSASVDILEQVATTTLDLVLRNPLPSAQEAELLVPVPDGAVVRRLELGGSGGEGTARILPREEARRIYDAIVAKARDPALVEFAGYNLVRSSVFPVPARGEQRIRLTYETIVPVSGGRFDYSIPRTEALDYLVPWKVTVRLRSTLPPSTVYSPSHDIETTRDAGGAITVRTTTAAAVQPGAFRLSWMRAAKEVAATFFAYPDPRVGGGYFLLLAGLPPSPPRSEGSETSIRREVTLVLDRSGSMRGEKIEQVREAALQIIAGLEPGEAFNVISYNDTIEVFSPRPVVKSAETERRAGEYLRKLVARSGTNIHDALLEALRQTPSEGRLPIVLFLTDGLPTVGQTSELAIRKVATEQNSDQRRIFTFGVGLDVNTPLLERIASSTRGTATFVLPRENVEVKVSQVFDRLAGPVLASPRVGAIDEHGRPASDRVSDLAPALLPDLFEEDQLVLLGKYRGDARLLFSLRGNYRGTERAFQFSFDPRTATVRNAFVPRLWASRKIARLEDAIRDLGATGGSPYSASIAAAGSPGDPRLKELVDEIVRLSTEFGILSEYTAFLADDGVQLNDVVGNQVRAGGNFVRRSVRSRVGQGSVNQDINRQAQKQQKVLNYRNEFYDASLTRVSISRVQQVADKAFFRRGDRWVDSHLASREGDPEPTRVVEFASPEFRRLTERLAANQRQGYVALRGEILLEIDGETILVRNPDPDPGEGPQGGAAAGQQVPVPQVPVPQSSGPYQQRRLGPGGTSRGYRR